MSFNNFLLFFFFFGMNKLSKRFRGVTPVLMIYETMCIIVYSADIPRHEFEKIKEIERKKLTKCFHGDMRLMG